MFELHYRGHADCAGNTPGRWQTKRYACLLEQHRIFHRSVQPGIRLHPLPGLPDLTETSVTNPPATVLDGSSFSVTDTVQNTGSAAAAASTTRYYLSTTTSKSGARLLTGSRAVPSLASSATSSGTVTVTVSAGTAGGTHFLLACAHYPLLVPENNDRHNLNASAPQRPPTRPDLLVNDVNN